MTKIKPLIEATVILFIAATAVAISVISIPNVVRLILFAALFLLAVSEVIIKAVNKLKFKNIFNEYLLISLSGIMAMAVGNYPHAIIAVTVFRLGKLIEGIIRSRSRQTVKKWQKSSGLNIIEAVERSADGRSATERAVTRFALFYTPVVIVLSIIVLVISLIAKCTWRQSLYSCATILALSSSFSLLSSAAPAFFSGIARAAKENILIKGSAFIDLLSRCTTFVFDKSGTLADDTLKVVVASPEKMNESNLLELVCLAYSNSNSRFARAARNASGGHLNNELVEEIQELSGLGIIAKISSKTVAVGNEKLMKHIGVETADSDPSAIHVAVGKIYAGRVVMYDTIKSEADKALYRLKSDGVKSNIMLTSDSVNSAASIADVLYALDEYFPNMTLPDKVETVENLMREKEGRETLAFVCGSINNSSAMPLADIGIVMSTSKLDTKNADIAILDTNLEKLPLVKRLAGHTLLTVKENVILTFAMKLVVIALASIGIVGLPTALGIELVVNVLTLINSKYLLNKRI